MKKKKKTVNNLWAPWRAEYIYSCGEEKRTCVFCRKRGTKQDRERLILYRGPEIYVLMNKFPYNNGHLMVVPYRHVSDITKLTRAENAALWDGIVRCRKVLGRVFRPHGFNIGMNLGRTAGAGIHEHCHIHIVPRWNGDTNFMPVFADVKVISEGLFVTYDRLKKFF